MRRLRTVCGLCLLLSAVFGPYRAAAEEVLVIQSGNLRLYSLAAEGVVSSFHEARGEHVTLLNLEEIKPGEEGAAPAKPDLVLTVGADATRYSIEHYPATPTVYCMVVRPERLHLPDHIIGISMFSTVADMLATLTLISGNVRHVGVLHRPEHRQVIQEAIDGLTGYEITLIPVEVPDERAFPKLARRLVLQSDALWIVPGSITNVDAFRFLRRLSFEHRVPLVGDSAAMVRAGALISITPDPVDVGRQAARLGGYLMSGESLPPDRLFYPDMANLAINFKTARAMGIEVPPMLADFASETVGR
ncbi:MAG: ABC transporter substrate-binding protein [Leptospirillia bacterium]